jgi:hypothetical protein
MDKPYFVEEKFTPFMLTGETETNLQKFFDGPIPKEGDRVELYCNATTETSVSLKWRVVKHKGG